MALLRYDGTAQDHETIPEVLLKGQDGKPQKRKVARPAQNVFKQIGTYNLRGMLFPQGDALRVVDKDIIKKAVTLGCFDVLIEKEEPITYDKKWLEVALQGDRVRLVDPGAAKEAEAPETATDDAPVIASDSYDKMKRPELMRLASTRGLSVDASKTKADIVKMLREQEAPALAEAAAESGGVDFDNMKDVG